MQGRSDGGGEGRLNQGVPPPPPPMLRLSAQVGHEIPVQSLATLWAGLK
jgi:hypothetical protein